MFHEKLAWADVRANGFPLRWRELLARAYNKRELLSSYSQTEMVYEKLA